MDLDPRIDEPRDRALSSEPSSTRPNPFDDDDSNHSARKRRRTSLSRSTSVETAISHDHTIGPSDSHNMTVGTPEPVLPSTPDRSDRPPPPEPVSSRVTLNLRNADSLEATPTSPLSPTPSRRRKGHARAGVEASEVDMATATPVDDASSSSSTLDSSEIAVISVEGTEDDANLATIQPEASFHRTELSMVVSDFPYRGDGEQPHDTLNRILGYFRQQPGNVEEGLLPIYNWVTRCLTCARFESQSTIVEVCREFRPFWAGLPDLIYQVGCRLSSTKIKEIRDLIVQLLGQYAKLTAFLVNLDICSLSQEGLTEETFASLMSPLYFRVLASLQHAEDPYLVNGADRSAILFDPLDMFQSCPGASLTCVIALIEYHTSVLPRSPRIILDHLVSLIVLVQSIVRDSVQKQSSLIGSTSNILDRSQKNIALSFKCFRLFSDALDLVIEKSISNLSTDHASSIIYYSSELLKHGLRSNNPDAIQRLHQYRQEHPEVPAQYVCEAAATEYRFNTYCKLIRSRQMQLRVSSAMTMCDDLVTQWKKHQDRQQDPSEDTQPYLDYLRYIAEFLMRTGIVDYILGPTCHPEITSASGNIIGFLGVSKTYTASQTNLLWQTLTSTQDPRIAEALVRMIAKVTSLLQPADLVFFVEKFQHVPVDAFTPMMRDLFDNITELLIKTMLPHVPPIASYEFCVRLLRESSVFAAQGSVAYPDIYQFATLKLRRLLLAGPGDEGRRNIALSCLDDIARKSATSTGSLQVVSLLGTNHAALQAFIEEHNFIQLLVDEFEAAVQSARSVGVTTVYANPFCAARRRLISLVVTQFGSAIDTNLGQRLWDHLVGDKSISHDDQKAGWEDLNSSLKRNPYDNPFLGDCVRMFLPKLPPSCHCAGSLSFVREVVLSAASDASGIILDDEESVERAGIELLWQIILACPNQQIADGAISTLINDIYVESKAILSYPLQRARKVHFSLVHRCLSQLKAAAQKLKAFNDGTTSNDDEPMVIIATDDQCLEQERRFGRTLQVLTNLTGTLRTKSHFAHPDLRSLMLSSPTAIQGELADLKFQSFDGDEQSDIKALKIGLQNSAASLLASLREATGFENYRLYYRGTTLAPSDADICKSLEELNMKSGLILVRRENELASSPVHIKPGASPLEIEILGHFNDLWEYLSMEETFARAIYKFLISLPADDSTLAAFESSETSPRDIFPLGHPFKSLYAVHALREYLNTRRLKNTMMHASTHAEESSQQFAKDQEDVLAKAMSLIVAGICDREVINLCSVEDMKFQLGFELIDSFVQLLKETSEPHLLKKLLTVDLYERLIEIIESGASAANSKISNDLVLRGFEALLDCSMRSDSFWSMLKNATVIPELVRTILLADERPFVRKSIAALITTRSLHDGSQSGVHAHDFAELFWSIMMQLLPEAVWRPYQCDEFFKLAGNLMRKLMETGSSVLDLPACIGTCGDLLLSHESIENITHPETTDRVAFGLISLIHQAIDRVSVGMQSGQFPTNFPRRLISRHLFPPEDATGPSMPHVVLHPQSRQMLYDIVYKFARDNPSQLNLLLQGLVRLTAHQAEDGAMSYKYELPQAFDRMNAIRSVCGYAGLRNLSNTCYLNSLFTQLFMNVGFRQFILSARIDMPNSQQLLSETQILFANLQDSSRRFIDPQGCVDQITTYDDLPIDIHSQMDVDEFFNLLFDRFEAQFFSDSDKKTLRSIYGGQLVQQVKSKECEHISERFEPFSAIQCDIKGKSSLEESLQAYVDGEIMEGDNKYKCTNCDRHVDAVKRACLKDLPDNLIFHLKRFDYNLRLLQRNKINDYFPFPDRIDMLPYTVEHLSNPSHSAEPDIFELVGVLVHSGTAETGHYYSFIRERPTNGSTPTWVEFNDDVVTAWDPSQMEAACFGGQDHRHYENGIAFEKVYSAYMLFYQRRSSLDKEQATLKSIGNPRQLRVDVPPELEVQVKLDNWAITQRHNLYDPAHVPFVVRISELCRGNKCSRDHRKETTAMHVSLAHLDQVASRAKDLPDFDLLNGSILSACQRCAVCCCAFFEYFQCHKEAFRMLLLKNADPAVRHDAGQLLLFVVRKIKSHYPDDYAPLCESDDASTSSSSRPSVIDSTADIFLHIWETFHTRPIAWPEYFGAMVDFAKLGRRESTALLDRGFLVKVLMTIAADQVFDLPPQYNRLVTVVLKRMNSRPPSYEGIIALADVLMDCMDTEANFVGDNVGRLSMAIHGDPIPFSLEEANILHKTWNRTEAGVFVDKLIQLNQNLVATDSILGRLVSFSNQMEAIVLKSLFVGITGHITSLLVTPYLRAGLTYCLCSQNKTNVHRLVRHVSDQCRVMQNPEARSFFDFERDFFEKERNTGESREEIEMHCLRNLPLWIPGLLGYLDRPVSSAVEAYVREKIFKFGTAPVFGESSGGSRRAQAVITAARELAVNVLYYLRETYVVRAVQIPRDTMQPFHRILQHCDAYFQEYEDMDDGLGPTYHELYPAVIDVMHSLTVDEIEDDGSDWEQSGASSDSLTDLNTMQVDQELLDGSA